VLGVNVAFVVGSPVECLSSINYLLFKLRFGCSCNNALCIAPLVFLDLPRVSPLHDYLHTYWSVITTKLYLEEAALITRLYDVESHCLKCSIPAYSILH
jgi:hypothetical protein